jgi:predicted  nucleic acid-binding Zn-ribbon protein
MKKYFLIGAFCVALVGCNTHEKELATLNRDRDSLMSLINMRDSSINEFVTSYNEIEKNLQDVAQKQNVIAMNVDKKSGELKQSSKDRINSEIHAINELMDQNRKQISELNRKLKNSNVKVAGFEKMIASLNEQITQKDNELTELNTKLASLNTQVAQLQTSVDTLGSITQRQGETINEQTASLHSAYYVVGKSKELQDSKVIDKTGGLLGIGKTSKLSNRFDNSKFTKIDYTQTTTIPVNSDAKIVTTHPSDSYELDKDAKNKNKIIDLRITNPEKFWSASKYLVVIKD